MNIWVTFYTVAVSQGFFVSLVLLLLKKGNSKANITLSILVLLLTIYLLDNLLGMTGFFYNNPHYLYVAAPLWYLFPPLFYFYVKIQVNADIKWHWYHLLHLIPFLIMLYQFLPFYFLPGDIKLQYFSGELKPPGSELILIFYVMISPLQLVLYSSIILFKKLRGKYNLSINPAHLNWIKIVFSLLFIFALAETAIITRWILTGEVTVQFKYVPLAIYSFIIYSIAYLAIVQPETLFSFNVLKIKKLNRIMTKQYADELIKLIEEEKLYLNSELKYSEVASRLGISARYLTEVLNREIGKGFNDFVNEYRVDEVKRRLLNNEIESLTLMAIAFESGFNSKSSFNRIFKKHTGSTPSEFIANTKALLTQKVS